MTDPARELHNELFDHEYTNVYLSLHDTIKVSNSNKQLAKDIISAMPTISVKDLSCTVDDIDQILIDTGSVKKMKIQLESLEKNVDISYVNLKFSPICHPKSVHISFEGKRKNETVIMALPKGMTLPVSTPDPIEIKEPSPQELASSFDSLDTAVSKSMIRRKKLNMPRDPFKGVSIGIFTAPMPRALCETSVSQNPIDIPPCVIVRSFTTQKDAFESVLKTLSTYDTVNQKAMESTFADNISLGGGLGAIPDGRFSHIKGLESSLAVPDLALDLSQEKKEKLSVLLNVFPKSKKTFGDSIGLDEHCFNDIKKTASELSKDASPVVRTNSVNFEKKFPCIAVTVAPREEGKRPIWSLPTIPQKERLSINAVSDLPNGAISAIDLGHISMSIIDRLLTDFLDRPNDNPPVLFSWKSEPLSLDAVMISSPNMYVMNNLAPINVDNTATFFNEKHGFRSVVAKIPNPAPIAFSGHFRVFSDGEQDQILKAVSILVPTMVDEYVDIVIDEPGLEPILTIVPPPMPMRVNNDIKVNVEKFDLGSVAAVDNSPAARVLDMSREILEELKQAKQKGFEEAKASKEMLLDAVAKQMELCIELFRNLDVDESIIAELISVHEGLSSDSSRS